MAWSLLPLIDSYCKTIEFRMPAGSTELDDISRWVETTLAFVPVCGARLGSEDLIGRKWDSRGDLQPCEIDWKKSELRKEFNEKC